MPRRSSRAALACFGLVAAIDLVAEFTGWQPVALVCRILLMPLLAWSCWSSAVRRTRLVILVVIALGCSWLGDLSAPVLIKIAFFLVAQIVYVVAFRPYWRRSLIARPPLLIAYGIALAGLVGVVAAAAGPLAGPVAVYGASLAVMAVLATGVSRLTGIGGALFLVSDIVLAVELFVAPGLIPYALFVNMALYLPAQLMITLGVLQQVSTEVEPLEVDRVA
ncbi:MAG TPA: lysoplasmalogenase family protein [Microlunatus sp.]